MKNKLEEQFDGICNKAMPLILFSYWKFKEPLIDKLSNLFRAYNSNDNITFDEIIEQINIMIDERDIFDSEKERLITVFSDRTKSYNDKFLDIYEEIDCLKKKLKIKRHSSKKQIENKEKIIIDEGKQDSILKSDLTKPIGIMKKCPRCNYSWNFKGKGNIRKIKSGKIYKRINCPECRYYFKDEVIE